jgi:hypothetical protein
MGYKLLNLFVYDGELTLRWHLRWLSRYVDHFIIVDKSRVGIDKSILWDYDVSVLRLDGGVDEVVYLEHGYGWVRDAYVGQEYMLLVGDVGEVLI